MAIGDKILNSALDNSAASALARVTKLFPIKIGDFRFFVNPTSIKVNKAASINEIRTMAGTTFTLWPDMPDEISFDGMAYGFRAITELRGLARSIQREPSNKQVTITYKFQKYTGFIRNLEVSADADNPRIFKYSLSFVSKDRFKLEWMPLGQTPSIKTEFDFFTAQLRSATSEIASLPEDILNGANAVFAQIFGKTGSATNGLGIFVGRPRTTSGKLFR